MKLVTEAIHNVINCFDLYVRLKHYSRESTLLAIVRQMLGSYVTSAVDRKA